MVHFFVWMTHLSFRSQTSTHLCVDVTFSPLNKSFIWYFCFFFGLLLFSFFFFFQFIFQLGKHFYKLHYSIWTKNQTNINIYVCKQQQLDFELKSKRMEKRRRRRRGKKHEHALVQRKSIKIKYVYFCCWYMCESLNKLSQKTCEREKKEWRKKNQPRRAKDNRSKMECVDGLSGCFCKCHFSCLNLRGKRWNKNESSKKTAAKKENSNSQRQWRCLGMMKWWE